MSGDLDPISHPVRATLRRLGLADVELLLKIMREWDEQAGPPWQGVTEPVYLRNGELVVRAESAGAIRMLRYATGALLQRLDDRYGEGTIQSIKVVPPGR